VKAILIQEIQAVGGAEAAAALGARLLDEDLCDPAAMALVAIREGAAEEFRRALPASKGSAGWRSSRRSARSATGSLRRPCAKRPAVATRR